MDCEITTGDKGLSVKLSGNLTFESYRDFKEVVSAIRGAKEDVTVSLTGINEMDSAGAGMLKLAQDQAKQSGVNFTITDVPPKLEILVSLIEKPAN